MLGRLVAVLCLVLGLILLLTWFARRAGFGQGISRGQAKEKRLKVLETRSLDNQRRLVLIQRDSEEHLLLIGGTNDIVIEQNIPPRHLGAEAISDDPLERVRFRDILPKHSQDKEARILQPGERTASDGGDA